MITPYFEGHRGGIEIVAGRLAREWANNDIEIIWIATTAIPEIPNVHCKSIKAGNGLENWIGVPFPIPTLGALGQISRQVADSDVVIVHDALYLTSIAGFLTARRFKKPVLVVQHIGVIPYRNPVLRFLMALGDRLVARVLLAHADQVVFISQATERHFSSLQYRVKPQLIFNGVDPEIFFPAPNADVRLAERRRHQLPDHAPVVLFVGRFVEKKGLAVLECVARAHPHITFAFAGWGPENPKRWGLENVYVFNDLSGVSLSSLYRASDVFVLPSVGEGFPLVIQEALASGLPVICSEETASADPACEGLVYSIKVTVNAGETAVGVAHALRRLLQETNRSSDDRAALAAERYSWPKAAARYVKVIATLTERAAGKQVHSA